MNILNVLYRSYRGPVLSSPLYSVFFLSISSNMVRWDLLLHTRIHLINPYVSTCSVYLLSLLPIVPNGIFAGTVVLSGIILYFVRRLRLNLFGSLAFIVMGYMLQDLAHWGTGEKTFQSTYSAGGSVRSLLLDLAHIYGSMHVYIMYVL